MKLYFGTLNWGWRLYGIVGRNAKWFIGFSKLAAEPTPAEGEK